MTDKHLHLHVPEFKELNYRRKILSDPDTMSYNAGYNLGFDGYDNGTAVSASPKATGRTGTVILSITVKGFMRILPSPTANL